MFLNRFFTKGLIAGCLVFLFVSASVKAQGFFISAQAGYGLGYPGQEYREGASDIRVDADGNTTAKGIYGTHGEGISFGVGLGGFFGEHVGAELRGNLLLGAWQVVDVRSDARNDFLDQIRTKSWQLRVIPSLILRTRSEGSFLYVKSGLAIALAGNTLEEFSLFNSSFPTGDILTEEEISYRISLGFTGALGMEFELSDMLGLFVEIEGITLRSRPDKGVFNTYTVNDVDVLDQQTTFFIERNYVDQLNEDSNSISGTNIDANSPEDQLSIPANFATIGMNLGVRINF